MRRSWLGTVMMAGGLIATVASIMIPVMRSRTPIRRVMHNGRRMWRAANMGKAIQSGRRMVRNMAR